ncbi:WhiB family transcriptional regulator [Streptomyces sp. NPDC006739]|uniref:WhiB family transcriptional regulator n=1 Tax=Streptomyces sp. NPDC006739 TaxID=3364763 RepID=UPI0036CDB247
MTRLTYRVHGSNRTDDWRNNAACRSKDVHPDAMFPDSDKQRIAAARAICAGCPVSKACLRDAITSGDRWGIRAGLTPDERRLVKRELNRRQKAAEAQQADGENATPDAPVLPRRKPYTTLRALFDDNTKRVTHGHLAWTGPAKPSFKNRSYNPKQIAFVLDRGREPAGRVLSTCSLSGCVEPTHIADDAERMQCGTRAGYERHLKIGEKPCEPCLQANRMRRTGSTKAAA